MPENTVVLAPGLAPHGLFWDLWRALLSRALGLSANDTERLVEAWWWQLVRKYLPYPILTPKPPKQPRERRDPCHAAGSQQCRLSGWNVSLCCQLSTSAPSSSTPHSHETTANTVHLPTVPQGAREGVGGPLRVRATWRLDNTGGIEELDGRGQYPATGKTIPTEPVVRGGRGGSSLKIKSPMMTHLDAQTVNW